MARAAVFAFGVISYLVFLASFVYAIGFVGGFLTPTSLDAAPTMTLPQALAIDLALLAAFAIQHSGMARPAFKTWWTKIVPPAAERSAYVLLSSLCMIVLFMFWQPIGGVIWEAPEGWQRMAVIGLNLFGWLFLLYATFLINHFDLFGLTQVWRRLADQPYGEPTFRTPSLYRLMRHPIYVGWLIIFWSAPTMTVAHLVFAVVTTLYILVAIQLEEHDLIRQFGKDYTDYKKRTPMLVPGLGGRSSAAPVQQE